MNYNNFPFRFQVSLPEKVKRHLTLNRQTWITGLGFFSILIVVINFLHPKPPLRIIRLSRIALHHASNTKAEIYSPTLHRAAVESWKSLLKEWRHQNDKLFLSRDFQKLAVIAMETNRLALQSEITTRQKCDSLQVVIMRNISILDGQLSTFREQFKNVPLSDNARKKYVQCELLLYKCQSALKQGDLNRAVYCLSAARDLLGQTGEAVSSQMNSYYSNLPNWSRWAEETIEWSRTNHDVAVVVDKMARKCKLYNDGTLMAEYTVELGPNWIGHKCQRGDCRTPEGKYSIAKKKENRGTIYYKALEIDYPNNTDLALFAEAKRKGWLPPTAEIGGYIEIHGQGGQKTDWTNGCVALMNKDMDHVYDLTRVGTPVTIVGSLRLSKN